MNKKILVIDDDDGILEAIEIVLTTQNYDVKTALSGQYIEKLIKNFRPHLIILDMLLSGEDGREIVKKLKSKPTTQKIPVVMISAHPSADKTVRSSGADDFIPKPFDIDVLLSTVAKYVP